MSTVPGVSKELRGLRVMVTRPAHLAHAMCRLLEEAGAATVRFPCIEIAGAAWDRRLVSLLRDNSRFAAVIFVSRNAVLHAHELLRRIGAPLACGNVIAIGAKTAQQLQSTGVCRIGYPQTAASSEAVIKDGLISGIRSGEVLIVRGQGGRGLLGDALRAQGAHVTYAEVYRRTKPAARLSFEVQSPRPDLILATSGEILRNLVQMTAAPCRHRLLQVPVVVGSRRLVALHDELGFRQNAVVADSPADEDMMKAVLQWSRRHR